MIGAAISAECGKDLNRSQKTVKIPVRNFSFAVVFRDIKKPSTGISTKSKPLNRVDRSP